MGPRDGWGAMRHRRIAVAHLLVFICLLCGCHGAGASDQPSSSAGTSNRTLASKASNDAAASVLSSTDDSANEQSLIGRWSLQQVQVGNGPRRPARPGETNLYIRSGTLMTFDACSQQLQAQVTVRPINCEAHRWHGRRRSSRGSWPSLRGSGSSRFLEHKWDH